MATTLRDAVDRAAEGGELTELDALKHAALAALALGEGSSGATYLNLKNALAGGTVFSKAELLTLLAKGLATASSV